MSVADTGVILRPPLVPTHTEETDAGTPVFRTRRRHGADGSWVGTLPTYLLSNSFTYSHTCPLTPLRPSPPPHLPGGPTGRRTVRDSPETHRRYTATAESFRTTTLPRPCTGRSVPLLPPSRVTSDLSTPRRAVPTVPPKKYGSVGTPSGADRSHFVPVPLVRAKHPRRTGRPPRRSGLGSDDVRQTSPLPFLPQQVKRTLYLPDRLCVTVSRPQV